MGKTKKLLIMLLLTIFLTVTLTPPARADTWGANMLAVVWKQTMEEIQRKIRETILANLRIVAIRIIQGRLMTLITGSPGGYSMGTSGLIISDWRQFIYGSAQRYSTQVTNDFFRNISSGTPAALMRNVVNPAQRAVNTDYWNMRPNLQNYVSGGEGKYIFTPGYASNPKLAWYVGAQPQNDPLITWLRAEGFKQEAFRQEEEKKKAEGVAGQGYKSVEKSSSNRGPYTATSSQGGKVTVPPGSSYTGGQNITMPAINVKDLASEALGMNLNTVSLSQSIPDIVSNLVVSMLTRFLSQGLMSITQSTDQQIMQIRSQTGIGSLGQIQNMIQSGYRSNTYFNR